MVIVVPDPLGKVSVVMIACAAVLMACGDSADLRSSRQAVIRSCGSGSPITPVEEEKTRTAGRPSVLATAPVTALTDSAPRRPVKALALPEFTRIAAPPSGAPPILS